MADAARDEPNQHLTPLRLSEIDLGQHQWLAELLEYRSLDSHGDAIPFPVSGMWMIEMDLRNVRSDDQLEVAVGDLHPR